MKTYFVDNKSSEIILFFLGWGMDEKPMLKFNSKKDILYFYDYSDLNFKFDFSKYLKIYLISYSAGVSIASIIDLPKIDYSIAINGVYELFNEKYGLTKDILEVFNSITLDNYLEFRKNYLVNSEEELVYFNDNQPLRTLDSSIQELSSLLKYNFNKSKLKYDKIYISKFDKIFDYKSMKEYWNFNTIDLNCAHFPFLEFNSIDEI